MAYRKAQAMTRTIRECCSRLDALEDALRRDAGITSAMLAVLEALHERGAQTVPQIARQRKVTRQHIQTVADRLLGRGFIIHQENPKDRRSPLLKLTEQGEAVYTQMEERELSMLIEVGRALDDHDVEVTLTTLNTLRAQLDRKRAERAIQNTR